MSGTHTVSKKGGTHLDETVGRVAVPEVGYGKELAAGDVLGDLVGADLHGEERDGMLLCTVGIGVILVLLELGVVYFVKTAFLRELIEDVAKGDTEGEEVPKLGDGVGGLAIVGGGE